MRVAARPAILALGLVSLVLLGGVRPAAADKKPLPQSNLSHLDHALTEAARTLVARAPISSGSRIALKRISEGSIAPQARRAVLAALTEKRVEVYEVSGVARPESAGAASPVDSAFLPGSQTPRTLQEARALQRRQRSQAVYDAGQGDQDTPPDETDLDLLVVTVDEARVDYPRLFRSGLFGGLHVERRAIASLSAQLLRPGSRAVYWVGAADTSLADYVQRSEVTLLEDATHPETKGTVPGQSWQKAIEPVLVIALVVGLVSLFYTNRP